MTKTWRDATISAISKTLYKVHHFDSDRSVAIAYWFKKRKLVRDRPGYYWHQWLQPTCHTLRDMTAKDADELLSQYNYYLRSHKERL